jgi:osmoprotectant transport system substrate-binding protein
MTIGRRTVIASPFVAGAALAQSAPLLRVGSKNFTEQLVVGELWAAALEAAGARVERRLNLGGTLIAQQALVSGQIDLYPEYTGTGLGVVLKEGTEGTAEEVLARVREGYRRRFGLEWLAASHVDNGNVLLVTPATARRHGGLATLSDLARVAPSLTLSAGSEFADRADGLPGLRRVYGMEFRRLRQFSALGLRYAALRHGQADVVNGYATDWQIAVGGFVSLADDRALWPPYQLAAVARPQAVGAFPRLAEVLDGVNRRLDNAVMQRLNREVDGDGDEPREAAARFLRTAQG